MAINIPTSISVRGPWLLSAEDLLEVDAIVEENLETLEKEKERVARHYADRTLQQIKQQGLESLEGEKLEERREAAYEEEKQRLGYQDHKLVRFFLSEGRTVTAETFAEAINHHGVAAEVPRGFSFSWRGGKVAITLRLGGRFSDDDKLELDVTPDDSDVAQQLFGAFQNWMGDHQPTMWLRFARKWRFGVFMGFVLWLSMCFSGFEFLTSESAKTSYKKEAQKMLQKGITAQDQQKAIELLLAIGSEYSPLERQDRPSGRFWAISLVGAAVFGALLGVPKFVIGVWGGRGRLRAWHAWLKFVGVTIPMLVFTTMLWPWVVAALGLKR